MRDVAAYDVSALMEHRGLDLPAAAETVIRQRLPGRAGLIALHRAGRFALPFDTEGMYRGWVDSAGGFFIGIYDSLRIWPVA